MSNRLDILSHVEEVTTGINRIDEFRDDGSFFKMGCVETGEYLPYTLDRNQEWRLTVTLTVTFWANQAQRHDAHKIAEKVLVSRLYGDVLADLNELRLQISNGDRVASMALCDRIMTKIT